MNNNTKKAAIIIRCNLVSNNEVFPKKNMLKKCIM